MNRKRNFLLLILLLALIQTTFLNHLRLFGVKPDLLLVAVIAGSLIFEVEFALLTGLICGILKDIFGVHIFGLNSFLMPITVFLVITLSRKIALDDTPILCAAALVIAALYDLVSRVILGYISTAAPFWASSRIILLGSLYTAAVFPPAFRLIKKTAYL